MSIERFQIVYINRLTNLDACMYLLSLNARMQAVESSSSGAVTRRSSRGEEEKELKNIPNARSTSSRHFFTIRVRMARSSLIAHDVVCLFSFLTLSPLASTMRRDDVDDDDDSSSLSADDNDGDISIIAFA
jgi:hypothetical protein